MIPSYSLTAVLLKLIEALVAIAITLLLRGFRLAARVLNDPRNNAVGCFLWTFVLITILSLLLHGCGS